MVEDYPILLHSNTSASPIPPLPVPSNHSPESDVGQQFKSLSTSVAASSTAFPPFVCLCCSSPQLQCMLLKSTGKQPARKPTGRLCSHPYLLHPPLPSLPLRTLPQVRVPMPLPSHAVSMWVSDCTWLGLGPEALKKWVAMRMLTGLCTDRMPTLVPII